MKTIRILFASPEVVNELLTLDTDTYFTDLESVDFEGHEEMYCFHEFDIESLTLCLEKTEAKGSYMYVSEQEFEQLKPFMHIVQELPHRCLTGADIPLSEYTEEDKRERGIAPIEPNACQPHNFMNAGRRKA